MSSTVIERYTVCIRVCRDKSRVWVRITSLVDDVNGARVRLYCFIPLAFIYCYAPKLIFLYYFLGDFNWIEFINNPINELADDDDDYVPSIDTSLTFDDHNDYYDNIDFDSLTEMKRRYYESEGFTIQTSSDDSCIVWKLLVFIRKFIETLKHEQI